MNDLIKATIEWKIPSGKFGERRQSLTEELTADEITEILGIMVKASVSHTKGPVIIVDTTTDGATTTLPHIERDARVIDNPNVVLCNNGEQ